MFPGVMLQFDIGRKQSILAVEKAMSSNQLIFLAAQKDIKDDNPKKEEIYSFGILAKINQILKQTDNMLRVLIESVSRAEAKFYDNGEGFIQATVKGKKDKPYDESSLKAEALTRGINELFSDYMSASGQVPSDLIFKINSKSTLSEMTDYIAANVNIDFEKKQEILAEFDVIKRAEILSEYLLKENDVLFYQKEIASKIKDNMDKTQKDYFIKEQIKFLSEELGDSEDPVTESEKFINKLNKLKLPKDTYEKLKEECGNLSKTPQGSAEANILRSYLELCFSLPWNKSSKDKINLKNAEKVLNEDHFGLEKVKERILEFLAVKKLSGSVKGQIICLVGPPGVGKTSIAKSLARAIGRKYVRMSLGGLGDESEIRGHRKTYVGAMPGRIISLLKQCKTNNPLFLFDEIDKLSKDYHGDPSSALLEVLDPEQNSEFVDRYLEVPFDLSKVMFIATANDASKIPGPLYDRMEIINLYSYTPEEKFNIAKRHLVPKQIKLHGIKEENLKFDDKSLKLIIDSYTKEAGVRELERKLSSIMRKVAKKIIESKSKDKCITINSKKVKEMLGPEKYKKDYKTKSEVGIVNGLAWTAVGGEILPIEVSLMKGKGKVETTGLLGDVMKESAKIATSYIRSNAKKLNISEDFYKNYDIHIHAPEGAVPKDGPSAGVTIATALVSALKKKKVNSKVAMTGEITLKGKVLPIGGLKEKTMAAFKNDVETVIIPSGNKSDIEKIDKTVKKSINFVFADNLNDVFNNAII